MAMPEAALEVPPISSEPQPKWFNSPVKVYEGSLTDIRQHIPEFVRRRFAVTHADDRCSYLNNHLNVIIRRPFGEDRAHVPVGVVPLNTPSYLTRRWSMSRRTR